MTELLAPAGDLDKLKIAIIYGADAVFIGGKSFSLRANASNFTKEDLIEGCNFAHKFGKKVYVTTNVIPHQKDKEGLIEYLKTLEEAKVDAIIAASPLIINTALEHTNLEVHISTQQSALNIPTVNYWYNKGATRVVLGRDISLDDIEHITKNVKSEIEVFIHGGMCAGYSGRCALSNHLTNRDANRGGCAHTCRWFFDLKQDEELTTNIPFSMGSKDLSAVKEITRLMDIGVHSLKIEGRMKSLHYIATVVNTYRQIIDEYKETKTIKDYQKYADMLAYAENRETSHGFFYGLPTKDEQLYEKRSERVMQNFVGLILDYNKETKFATVETKNVFLNEELEIFSPSKEPIKFMNEKMYNKDGQLINRAARAREQIQVYIPFEVKPFDMLRAKRT
ncbi:peptidase U32 family protein [Acholeplasma granularum]|uniref:peptidase U32 family protein n=1 Tax=Acholeplasma granularum TaxID=264635 RepID=UPI0004706511|nr:U32 family peptidase [Acholeplasma granularum]